MWQYGCRSRCWSGQPLYLRRTQRKNKDGTVAHYLQLAHNVRDPDTGVVKAQILHSFGRAEHLEREALERLIVSIARYLDQDPPLVATSSTTSPAGSEDVEAVDARNLGGAWVLDQLWRRLEIDAAVTKVACGRKFDAARVERTLFALVASRALAPSSKLEVVRWIADDVHIAELDQVDADGCYRAMDFLLEALDELQQTVFFTAADLLSLDVDLIFFDYPRRPTSSSTSKTANSTSTTRTVTMPTESGCGGGATPRNIDPT